MCALLACHKTLTLSTFKLLSSFIQLCGSFPQLSHQQPLKWFNNSRWVAQKIIKATKSAKNSFARCDNRYCCCKHLLIDMLPRCEERITAFAYKSIESCGVLFSK